MGLILVVILAVTTTVYGAYQYVDGLQKQNIELTKSNTNLTTANTLLESDLSSMKQQADNNRILYVKAKAKYDNSQKQLNHLYKIFGRHDLDKIADRKPKMLEKRINAATVKVFGDIEKASKP